MKRKKMKPVTAWVVVNANGKMPIHAREFVSVFTHKDRAWYALFEKGDHLVRVRITEAPKKRAKCRSKKP